MRLIVWFLILLAVAAGAAWLADRPGAMVIDWAGWRLETSLAVMAALLLAVLVLLGLLQRLWLWLRRGPGAIGAARERRRRRRGYSALTRGLVAVAAGDGTDARRHAETAERLLDEPPLTLLLSAQAAQLAGDEAAAGRHFAAMLESPETEFLGVRGLLAQAVRRGDRARALELAQRARRLRPGTPWVLRELFALQTAEGRWSEASGTAAEAGRRGLTGAEETRRRQAVLTYARARQAEAAGQPVEALKLARKAHDLDPGLVPAAVLAAQLLLAKGKRRRAARIVSTAWSRNPHGDLVAAYGAIYPDEDPARWRVRLAELVAHGGDHPEGRLALARAALDAGDTAAARSELEPLLSGGGDARAMRLMAEVDERQYGDGASARDWLLKAAGAAEPAWACGRCGWRGAVFTPTCTACDGFDTLSWSTAAPDPVPRLAGTSQAAVELTRSQALPVPIHPDPKPAPPAAAKP